VLALAEAIALIKANSAKWMNEHRMEFAWQQGYGAFSVSASSLNVVQRYIENQEHHHRKMTFEEEFMGLLKKHGIPFEPNYALG
jgi:putative transposase